jgi:hypothetical protein
MFARRAKMRPANEAKILDQASTARAIAKVGPNRHRSPMAIVFRDLPPGYDWGWYSREDPRMHLQTVDKLHRNLYKVWLERAGRRVFEAAEKMPAKVLKRLQTEVEAKRSHVEGRWVDFLIDNNWLHLRTAGSKMTLIVYPDTPNRFTRVIDLRGYFREEALAEIGPGDVVLNSDMGAIEIWPRRPQSRRHHIQLAPLLWHD